MDDERPKRVITTHDHMIHEAVNWTTEAEYVGTRCDRWAVFMPTLVDSATNYIAAATDQQIDCMWCVIGVKCRGFP